MVEGAPRLVTTNVRLKHRYDYEPLKVDPASIARTLKVGHWRSNSADRPISVFRRIRERHRLGGGWKNVRFHVTRNLQGGFIVDGDWDLDARPFEIRPSVVDMFQRGVPAQETDEYQRILRKIEAGDYKWTRGCYSVDDLDRYFQRLEHLYAEIDAHGYRSQAELGLEGSDEIRVCVGRRGELIIFGGGTHRLSIARILDIEVVPVLVKRVHARWVQDWIDRTGTRDPMLAIDRGLTQLSL